MRYIPDGNKAIFFDENKIAEAQAQQIIECERKSRDASQWESENILDGESYRIVTIEGSIDDNEDGLYEEIDPIFFCYLYDPYSTYETYDAGSWDLQEAIKLAREESIDQLVRAVGLRERYTYRVFDIQEDVWEV